MFIHTCIQIYLFILYSSFFLSRPFISLWTRTLRFDGRIRIRISWKHAGPRLLLRTNGRRRQAQQNENALQQPGTQL